MDRTTTIVSSKILVLILIVGIALGYFAPSFEKKEADIKQNISKRVEAPKKDIETPSTINKTENNENNLSIHDMDNWMDADVSLEATIFEVNDYAMKFHLLSPDEQAEFFRLDRELLTPLQNTIYQELADTYIRIYPEKFEQLVLLSEELTQAHRLTLFRLFATTFPDRGIAIYESVKNNELPEFAASDEDMRQLGSLLSNVLSKHPPYYEVAMELYAANANGMAIMIPGSTVKRLAEHDAEWVYLKALAHEGLQKSTLLEAAINKIASADLPRATTYILENKNELRQSMLQPVVEAYMENNDIVGLAELYQQLMPNGDDYTHHFAQGTIKNQIAQSGVDTMLAFVKSIQDPKTKQKAIEDLTPGAIPDAFFTVEEGWRLQKEWFEPYVGEKFKYKDIGLLPLLYPKEKAAVEAYLKRIYKDPEQYKDALHWVRRAVH